MGSDELNADDVFDCDVDVEFNEPDELDFEMRDFVLADNDVLFALRADSINLSWNYFGILLRALRFKLPGYLITGI